MVDKLFILILLKGFERAEVSNEHKRVSERRPKRAGTALDAALYKEPELVEGDAEILYDPP